MVILVLCAVVAVVFILAVGVGMKFFLKRENGKRYILIVSHDPLLTDLKLQIGNCVN